MVNVEFNREGGNFLVWLLMPMSTEENLAIKTHKHAINSVIPPNCIWAIDLLLAS